MVRAWLRVLGGREMRKTVVLVGCILLTLAALGCMAKMSRQGFTLEVGPSEWQVEVNPSEVLKP